MKFAVRKPRVAPTLSVLRKRKEFASLATIGNRAARPQGESPALHRHFLLLIHFEAVRGRDHWRLSTCEWDLGPQK